MTEKILRWAERIFQVKWEFYENGWESETVAGFDKKKS